MAKYSKRLVEKMVSLIEEDAYTITDICKMLDVNRKTFYDWKNTNADFAELVNAAKENREERLKMVARQAMKKKLDGYKLVETKTVYAIDKHAEDAPQLSVKEYVVKDKYCVPETSAIALTLFGGGSKVVKKGALAQEEMRPLTIVVSSEKAKKDLEMLKESLSSGTR